MKLSQLQVFRFTSILAFAVFILEGCYGFRPAAAYINYHQEFRWVRDSSTHFQYSIEPGLWSKERMDSIKIAMEQNFSNVLQKISQDTVYPAEPIYYFIVSNNAKIDSIINLHTSNYSFDYWKYWLDSTGVAHDEQHYLITTLNQINTNGSFSREKSLLGIVMSNKLWNICDYTFNDAIGIYIHDNFKGYKLHDLASFLYQKEFTLSNNRTHFPRSKPMVFNPLYASLMKFAVEKYKIGVLKSLCYFDLERFFLWDTANLVSQGQIISSWEAMLQSRKTTQIDTIIYKVE